MKISICIPTCNRDFLLEEAIKSILSQTYAPWEILIGDDSSNDLSSKLVNKLKHETSLRINYFKNNPRLGQADNVNALIDKISGEKMVLLHDDDILLPDALENMKNCFETNPDIEAVFGKQYIINEIGEINLSATENLNEYFFRTSKFAKNKISSFETGIVQQFPNDCYMIDSAIAKETRYRSKEEIGNAGDFDFGFRLGLRGCKFYFLDMFIAKYRVTSSSVARNGTDSGYQAYKIISETKFLKDYPHQKTINRVLKNKAPIAIFQAVKLGRTKEASAIFFSSHHRKKLFTPGGVKRLIMIFLPKLFMR